MMKKFVVICIIALGCLSCDNGTGYNPPRTNEDESEPTIKVYPNGSGSFEFICKYPKEDDVNIVK